MRFWLLELLAESGAPDAQPLLIDQFRSDDESLRHRVVLGLEADESQETQRALWEADQMSSRPRRRRGAFGACLSGNELTSDGRTMGDGAILRREREAVRLAGAAMSRRMLPAGCPCVGGVVSRHARSLR
jgi:hypothetical protein